MPTIQVSIIQESQSGSVHPACLLFGSCLSLSSSFHIDEREWASVQVDSTTARAHRGSLWPSNLGGLGFMDQRCGLSGVNVEGREHKEREVQSDTAAVAPLIFEGYSQVQTNTDFFVLVTMMKQGQQASTLTVHSIILSQPTRPLDVSIHTLESNSP